ncbi:ATP synthase F1 subunit gamma [Candidatus Saccharibacteria bacterium RIFCSPHIGHO2_12_FULL_47_16b]|nr:MAG: ATP synthase F1 subunit gamma [Candidatus Saccharibacteria bacterium RIFCSPHIGHO2_12_FULL_47_16b]
MAQTQVLKRRIRSVSNTQQITKAMELVAATKMRRVQDAAVKARVYNDAAITALRRLSANVEVKYNPFFRPTGQTKLYIIFTSDRGLAGAYNANIFNSAGAGFAADKKSTARPAVVVYGRKGARHFARGTNIDLLGAYENIPDIPDINIFAPVIDTIIDGVSGGKLGAIDLIYTESISTLNNRIQTLKLVPIQPPAEPEVGKKSADIVYELEPNAEEVLASTTKLYLESSLWRARIEAAASEHAMRMISMNNANRNAGDLIDGLTLELNATRQAAITQEMAEIISAAEAIT